MPGEHNIFGGGVEFGEKAAEMYIQSVRNSILSAIYLPLVLTISSAAIAIALLVGGTQSILGERSVGEIVMFMYFAVLFFQQLDPGFGGLNPFGRLCF